MAKTISQRISLEGSEDIRKKLEELGKTGEQAFKTIQDAAKKPIADAAQVERTKQAIDQLVQAGTGLQRQFEALTGSAQQFGQAGAQSSQQVTAGLNQTTQAAAQTGAALQQSAAAAASAGQNVGAGLISSANAFRLAAAGIIASILAIRSSLTKGAAETAGEISDQAGKVKLSVKEWLELRKQIDAAGGDAEDFVKAAEKIGKVLDEAAGGAVKLGGATVTLQRFGENVVTIYGGVAKGSVQANAAAQKLVNTLVSAGAPVSSLKAALDAIAKGDRVALMRAFADAIAGMTDETQKAAIGAKIFGDNWKALVEQLRTSKSEADKSKEAIRQLSAEQVEAGTKMTAAWKDVSAAFRALKDRIGALFFSTTMPDWLVAMIDGANKLLKQWSQLAELKKQAFLEGLGDSPAELLFKTLLAVGQQLAGLWRDVLVPAGRQILGVFTLIAAQIDGVSKSKVAAFFITAALAATALAVALKGIQFVLAPLMLLFTPFAAVLIAAGAAAVVFWDQIAAGAAQVAALVPESLHTISVAFQNLFAGNFSLFWEQFSRGATQAFQTIIKTLQQTEGVFGDFVRALTGGPIQTPWVQELADGIAMIGRGIKQIATDAPGAIGFIIKAFVALGMAATAVADGINAIFGTKLTGTDIGLLIIVGQLTGALGALGGVIAIVAGSLAGLGSAISIAGALFSGLLAVFGGLGVALIAGAALLVTYMGWWPQVAAAAQVAIGIISQAWQGFVLAFTNGIAILSPLVQGFWTAFTNGLTIIGAGLQLFASLFINGLTIIANAGIATWNAIQAGWNAAGAAIQSGIDTVVGLFTGAWQAIQQAGVTAFAAVQGAIDAVIGTVSSLISAISTAISDMLKLIGLGGNPGQAGSTGSWAGGGQVGGRGTGTSDSNLAWVSRGEHIMPARAVRQPGVLAFLEALRRSGGNLGRVLDGMGRFARGGLVPSFASGGMTGMSNVTIQFPGLPDVGGLRAAPSAVEQLRRAAVLAQVRSGGRKPSRYS